MSNENIKNSCDVYSSSYVGSSSDVDSSRGVFSSRGVYSSRCVDSSRDVYSSRYVYSSRDVIFCHNIKCKEFYAFNKQVTEKRFYEIKNYWDEIKGNFKLELKDNNWEDEWKNLPMEVWRKLSELPEFDKSVVESIIGFELDLDDSVEEMTMEELCKELGRTIKIKK